MRETLAALRQLQLDSSHRSAPSGPGVVPRRTGRGVERRSSRSTGRLLARSRDRAPRAPSPVTQEDDPPRGGPAPLHTLSARAIPQAARGGVRRPWIEAMHIRCAACSSRSSWRPSPRLRAEAPAVPLLALRAFETTLSGYARASTAGARPLTAEAFLIFQVPADRLLRSPPLARSRTDLEAHGGARGQGLRDRALMLACCGLLSAFEPGTAGTAALPRRAGRARLLHSALFSPAKYGIVPELVPATSGLSAHEQRAARDVDGDRDHLGQPRAGGWLLGASGESNLDRGRGLLGPRGRGRAGGALGPAAKPAAGARQSVAAAVRDGWGAIRAGRAPCAYSILGSMFFWLICERARPDHGRAHAKTGGSASRRSMSGKAAAFRRRADRVALACGALLAAKLFRARRSSSAWCRSRRARDDALAIARCSACSLPGAPRHDPRSCSGLGIAPGPDRHPAERADPWHAPGRPARAR